MNIDPSHILQHLVDQNDRNDLLPERLEQAEQLEALLLETASRIRFVSGTAIRSLLSKASTSSFSKKEGEAAQKSSQLLVDVLRNTAVLLDSLHELSRSEMMLSRNVPEIFSLAAKLIGACSDIDTLALVQETKITQALSNFDKIAEVIEKSEDVFSLLGKLEEVEIGVNNLGISKEDFDILAGCAHTPKVENLDVLRLTDKEEFDYLSRRLAEKMAAGAKTPEELEAWFQEQRKLVKGAGGKELAQEPEPFDQDPASRQNPTD